MLAPGNSRLVYNWFKPNERATANAFWLGGMQLGVVVGGPLSALIVSQYGWRAVFYVFGVVGVILTAIMFFLLSERPEQHRFISAAERAEIIRRPAGRAGTRQRRTRVARRAAAEPVGVGARRRPISACSSCGGRT